MKTKLIGAIPLKIPQEPLLQRIGFTNNKKVTQRVEKNVDKAMHQIQSHAEIQAIYKEISIKRKNGSVTLEGGVTFNSKKLRNLLYPCDKVVAFLVTLGDRVDKLIHQSLKNCSYLGFILDAAASVAAESAAQYIQNYIDERVCTNGKITLRYSPGYCDWPLKEQQKIFQILPSKEINVKLSGDCLMSPSKTISGVIGVCTNGSKHFSRNVCSECENRNCPYRRTSRSSTKEDHDF